MGKKKSIKEIKAEMAANRKRIKRKTDKMDPNHKSSASLTTDSLSKKIHDKRVKKINKQIDRKSEDIEVKKKEIDNNENLTDEEKKREKQKLDDKYANTIQKKLKQAREKLKGDIRKKRRNKTIAFITIILLPLLMIVAIGFIWIWFMQMNFLNQSAATIATLADPSQRAELKARGILTDNYITDIPSELIGDLPGGAGSGSGFGSGSGSGSGKSKSDDSGFTDVTGDTSTADDVVKVAAKWFKQNTDLTDGQIAGILGNWYQESNLKPLMTNNHAAYSNAQLQKVWNDVYKHRQPGVDGGDGGMGLGQWTGSRATAFLKASNYDPKKGGTVAFQLEYLIKEGQFNGKKSWSGWLGGTDADGAAKGFYYTWEEGGASYDKDGSLPTRQAQARKFLPIISSISK